MSRRALHFRRLGVRFAVAGAALVAAGVAVFHGGAAGATTLKTFATPGSYTWKVPTGVTGVTFDVLGARGGSVLQNSGGVVNVISSGGAGGEAKARFAVHAGEVFEIVVGGQGGSFTQGASGGGGAGGFNGGGGGASSGGGGGASDVRIGGRGNTCAGSKACGFGDRIIVGGGGGGGTNASNINGDAGGGATGGGVTCANNGPSATQECGGFASAASCVAAHGTFGQGGTGCTPTDGGGAGGGGWFGGSSRTGGGGSGFINTLSTSGSFPGGLNKGDGKVIITTG